MSPVNFIKEYKFHMLWAGFFLFLLFQHRYVFMHYDDFGYATLSYGTNDNPNINDMNWNLSGRNWNVGDLLEFLKWHYFNWGGRVIPFFILTMALSCGEIFIKIFQSCLLFIILFLSYSIVKKNDKDFFAALLIIVSYCALSLAPVSEGVFWYTAAAVYIWPLFFLFGGLLLFRESHDQKIYFVGAAILLFFAACSHEQIAMLTMVTVIVFGILKFRETKTLDKKYCWLLFAVIAGGLIEILAPGNFVRAALPDNVPFYQMSLLDKIFRNVPIMLYILLNPKITTLMLSSLLFMVGFKIFQKNEGGLKFYFLSALNVSAALILYSAYGIFFSVTSAEGTVGRLIFMLIFLAEVTFYLLKTKNYILQGLFQGATCATAMMIMSPEIGSRSMLPFLTVSNLIFAAVFVQSIGEQKFFNVMTYALAGVICIFAFNNVLEITKGYHGNDFVNRLNRFKLMEGAARIAAGEKVNAILLYRLPDDKYNSKMPYHDSRTLLMIYEKKYFGIPQEVPIFWNTFGERNDLYDSIVGVEIPKIENITIDKMDLEKGLRIIVTPKNEGTIPLIILINGKEADTVQEGVPSAYIPLNELNVAVKVQIKNPLINLTSEPMTLTLDKDFVNKYRTH